MHPKNSSITDFIYELPAERIAKYPLAKRDESKLLIYDNGIIEEDVYSNLADYLPDDTLLIFNNTKVIEARLLFTKHTGSRIEIFCLEPDQQYADITSAMMQTKKVLWNCLIGGAKKWKEEFLFQEVFLNNKKIILSAKIIEKKVDSFLIEFNWHDTHTSFAEILHAAGIIPLPPYLNRDTEEADKKTYQTVYAHQHGSVAAPTAGLHFTNELLNKLSSKNIESNFITLHVGAGTFKPVKAAVMKDHEMHAEFIDVSVESIEKIIAYSDKNIVAVGTSDAEIVSAINQIIDSRGGILACEGDKTCLLSLPIGGLLSDIEGHVIAERYEQVDAMAKELGSTLSAPFMTVAFMSLLVIPELKLGDRGLFDGRNFKFVELMV